MAQSLGINKQSKLFQKFMNQKNSKFADWAPQKQKEPVLGSISFATNQNQASLMNRSNRSTTDLTAKTQSFNNSEVRFPKIDEKAKNSEFLNPPTNTKMIDNSLNRKNALGLDQILRRAIEKVRESKIQDLFERKNESLSIDNQHKSRPFQTKIKQNHIQTVQIHQTSSLFEAYQKQYPQNVEEINNYLQPQAEQKQQFQASKQLQITQLWEKKVIQANKTIKQLQEQAKILKQKVQHLSQANLKLKSQINKETNLSQKIIKQNKELTLQIHQLQNLISNKEIHVKQKTDDANYWKNQSQLQKNNTQSVKNSVKRLEETSKRLIIENENIKREKEQKEEQIFNLKVQYSKLNEENTLAKKYLCQLTFKLYSYQKQYPHLSHNILRNQHQVPQEKTKHAETYIKQNSEHQMEVSSVQVQKIHRKRQFSRQRHQKSNVVQQFQNKNTQLDQCQKITPKKQIKDKNDSKAAETKAQVTPSAQPDTLRQQKLAKIEQQLKQIRQLAFINGKMRRRKIDLQRQLQQLKF